MARDGVYELLEKGAKLSSSAVDNLEGRLKKKPADTTARIQLLGYYRTEPVPGKRTRRTSHILWVLRNDAVERLGLPANVLRINCAGDPLADEAGFAEALPLWLGLAEKSSAKDQKLRWDAVEAIQYCAPEKAEELLLAAGDRRRLAQFYSLMALGVAGESYQNYDPTGSDAKLRELPIAERARQMLATADDKEFLEGGAGILYTGAILWADGKLDWDYTALGKRILPLALRLNPEKLRLLTLPTELPARGERPPMTIRVGGNVQFSKIARQPKPKYPPEAKARGIEGTVRMETLLDLDGTVLGLNVVSGPEELVKNAVASVRQWAYRPTLLNGRPCYIMTLIEVNYRLTSDPLVAAR